MKKILISLVTIIVLVMMMLPTIPAVATEDFIVFADDFGTSSSSEDTVTNWDVVGYADWDVDSDGGGSDATLRDISSNRYLRLRSNDYVEKHNISTAGLENIHLEYSWGQEVSWDMGDDGDLVVQWRVSGAGS